MQKFEYYKLDKDCYSSESVEGIGFKHIPEHIPSSLVLKRSSVILFDDYKEYLEYARNILELEKVTKLLNGLSDKEKLILVNLIKDGKI